MFVCLTATFETPIQGSEYMFFHLPQQSCKEIIISSILHKGNKDLERLSILPDVISLVTNRIGS